MTHLLKHNDHISFSFWDIYQGQQVATYRVHSAIADAFQIGGDPVLVVQAAGERECVWLVRTMAQGPSVGVMHGDRLAIEGKYYTAAIDGTLATLVRIGGPVKEDKP
jgi:hypothetical protein